MDDSEQLIKNRYQYLEKYTKYWDDFVKIKSNITEMFEKSNSELSAGYLTLSLAILAALLGWFGFNYPQGESIGLLPVIAMCFFFGSVISSLIFRDLFNTLYLKGIKISHEIIKQQTEVAMDLSKEVLSESSEEAFVASVYIINKKYLDDSNKLLENWNTSKWSNYCTVISYVTAYCFVYGLFVLVDYITMTYLGSDNCCWVLWYLCPFIYFICMRIFSKRYLNEEIKFNQ